MTAPLLIGLAGLKGAGKDTAAEWLCFHGFFERIALTDPIKDGLAAMLGLHPCTFSKPPVKDFVLDVSGCTPQHSMHTLGAEWGRRYIVSRNSFTRNVQKRIDINNSMGDAAPSIVITDIRFQHEIEWLREQGGRLWHIVRDWKTQYDFSRKQGIEIPPSDTIIINTGSFYQLYWQLEMALELAQ